MITNPHDSQRISYHSEREYRQCKAVTPESTISAKGSRYSFIFVFWIRTEASSISHCMRRDGKGRTVLGDDIPECWIECNSKEREVEGGLCPVNVAHVGRMAVREPRGGDAQHFFRSFGFGRFLLSAPTVINKEMHRCLRWRPFRQEYSVWCDYLRIGHLLYDIQGDTLEITMDQKSSFRGIRDARLLDAISD